MKKLLAGGTLAVLAFGGMIATAAPASAHIPNATADCAGLNVDLKMYPSGTTIDVVIDGVSADSLTLSSGWGDHVKFYAFEDQTVAHEWSVSVDSPDSETLHPDGYDYEASGVVEACAEPPAKEVVSPATPEPVAGCAASLDDVILPGNTEAITYTKTEAGIVAALTSDAYVFPEDLGNYVLQADGTALLPAELVVIEEECEPAPEPSEPSVEPSEEASVPPVAEEPSASPSPVAEEPEELAATGATVGGAIAFAALLAAGGIALVWARRRMQNA